MNCKNKSPLNNLRESGIFLPLILFFAFVFGNHILFLQRNYIDFNWRFLFAFFGGCSKDIFIFCMAAMIFHLISKPIPALKKVFVVILHSFIIFPILDYYVFKATLERFNWNVLQFVNYHSAKGYLGNMGLDILYLLLVCALFLYACYFSLKKPKLIAPNHIKPFAALLIFLLFSCIFAKDIEFIEISNFTAHLKTLEGKNRILKNLISGSVKGFFPKLPKHAVSASIKPYTDIERQFLIENGFLPDNPIEAKESKFDRVILIVMESIAYEYLHCNNPDIPAEASPYLDYLTANYPHLTNFYTADCPSLQGLNVILSGKMPFNINSQKLQEHNLAAMFEKKHKDSTWFLRGYSRVYGSEEITIQNVFGFSKLIGYEDLAKMYPEPGQFTWGFWDSTIYAEALNILSKIKDKNYFILINLLNQHQPISDAIVKAPGQPESVKKHPNDLVKAIFNTDQLLKEFITTCESEGIIDERTLIVITSDHYPPLGYGHTELINTNPAIQLGKLPLIFFTKQKQAFADLETNKLCCQLDIAPTICQILGMPIPEQYMGHSLLDKNFKGRNIGILNNETVFFQSDKFDFSESLSEPATKTIAIKKWINNLDASLSLD